MYFDVFIIQLSLGIILFFIINWIGKHSYSIGYISISVFVQVEEAPAFNYLIRVLTPLVYIIISAAILYSLNLDRYVINFYLVNIYYLIFRLIFNLITGRGLLLNWYRQLLYWVSIVSISYFIYIKLIINRSNLLPDFESLSNEMWIIILIFLFQISNNIRLSSRGTEKRKAIYLNSIYNFLVRKYGHLIDSKTNNEKLKGIIYSILVIENFNRPKMIRLFEYIHFFIFRTPHTLGIMQFNTTKYITDIESVSLGVEKIINSHEHYAIQYTEGIYDDYPTERGLARKIIEDYNVGSKYNNDVVELWNQFITEIYPNTQDNLLPLSQEG